MLLGACHNKNKNQVENTIDSAVVTAATDSTWYGVAGECGMSTFCLITEKGDTMYVTRDSEDGRYGEIYGDLNEGDRFSMTTCDDNMALVAAINLSQVARFVKEYEVKNGHLVLPVSGGKKDTVHIESLDDKGLVVVYPGGEKKTFTEPLNK